MKRDYIEMLQSQGIDNSSVLDAMQQVDRQAFISSDMKPHAEDDRALPIDCGQTISQPYIVARMSSLLLQANANKRVLEIGTGSAYQAAVLSHLFQQVYSIERILLLFNHAKALLHKLSYTNINLRYADGCEGWSEMQPFDAIIVTAATSLIPENLLSQLAIGGRLLLPLGDTKDIQHLCAIDKCEDGSIKKTWFDGVRFVPMLFGVDAFGVE